MLVAGVVWARRIIESSPDIGDGVFSTRSRPPSRVSKKAACGRHGGSVTRCRVHAWPFAARPPKSVENGSDSLIRRLACEISNKLLGCSVGFPTVLPGAVLRNFKRCMVTTFPTQLDSQSISLHSNSDFLKHRAQNPPACGGRRCWIVPQGRERRSQCQDLFALSFGCHPEMRPISEPFIS